MDVQGGTSRNPGHLGATPHRGDLFDAACPTRQLLDRVGTKWTTMLVLTLDQTDGELRFTELKRALTGISQKMLTQTLRSLERDGLVTRRVEPSVPPRVFYGLTARGKSLAQPLSQLREWAEMHMPQIQLDQDAFDRSL
ncbi:winged helix-turn-helix transcriptional regulator [Streptomyces sp. NBC_00557]|uniref:winged helix-turn-helix transcriptional regulator n=1 Tax=Streptomyces sp. NBC_00557 TaxID=2975776 RepID=UPI002E8180FF|nr:helix-turn-helix domain-containing protein [Streptomyces sp. NBC_00557]WUC38615.1 helix-turn-helix transcriptional regulator [Streptomyces sp. NBC_00557]